MGYIYKITNKVNNKAYIGKTELYDPYKRWEQHIKDSKRSKNKQRPLYKAFAKYGIDNFTFEVIETVDDNNILAEREQFYIQQFNTFGSNGYNATLGGDGKSFLDYSNVISLYEQYHNLAMVARLTNMDSISVRNYLLKNNIVLRPELGLANRKNDKAIRMLDKNTLETIKEFSSVRMANQWLVKNNYLTKLSSSHVTDACRGKRITAHGFKWKYKN